MKRGTLHFGLMETDNYSSYNLCHSSKGFIPNHNTWLHANVRNYLINNVVLFPLGDSSV